MSDQSKKKEAETDAKDFWDDDLPREVIEDLAVYEVTSEAIRAYDAGEIDLWIENQRPKSMEDWDKWAEELKARGITNIDTRWAR